MQSVRTSHFRCFLSLVGVFFLAACGSGSDRGVEIHSNSDLSVHQAIDGYVVNATVFCDGVRNGQTTAAGLFTCPKHTQLITVRGGSDVGFDENSVSGGVPFIGELQGPAKSRYITPLTTVAAKMSTSGGVFNEQTYAASERTLTDSLGIPGVALSSNPIGNLPLLKANAKIHQLVAQFTTSADDYATVTGELANMLRSGSSIDLNNDTNTIISMLNQQLLVTAPALAQTPTSEAQLSTALAEKNTEIDQSSNLAELESVTTGAASETPYAFSIDKHAPLLAYETYRDTTFYTLDQLQNPTTFFGYHQARFNLDWIETVYIANEAFSIKKPMDKATVDVAVEFKSTSDNRMVSATLSGVKLSMHAEGSTTIDVEVPPGSIINARAVNKQGIVTDVSLLANKQHLASSDNGGFIFDFRDVNRKLREANQNELLYEYGNYQMTVVISGVRFSVTDRGNETGALEYTVTNAAESVTGYGLRGYVSRAD